MCAYILSPLGDQIFKASKCTHCASSKSKCGQAGALYRFDKDMSEGHLIDPYASSESESSGSVLSSSSVSSPESTDSGNEGGSEDLPSSANTSANLELDEQAQAQIYAQARAQAPPTPRGSTSGSASSERARCSSAPSLSPPKERERLTGAVPPPLKLEKRSVDDAQLGMGLRAESPGKSVRFALPPPSPPLSNNSPTANGHDLTHQAPVPASPVSPTRESSSSSSSSRVGIVTEKVKVIEKEKNKAKSSSPAQTFPSPSASPPSSSASAAAQAEAVAEERKLHRILAKLADLEVRLACLEGVNGELRSENRKLAKKNSTLKRVVFSMRASNRVSGDALARALKLVEDVETDRRRLMEEIK
jgi:hypothetical protein